LHKIPALFALKKKISSKAPLQLHFTFNMARPPGAETQTLCGRTICIQEDIESFTLTFLEVVEVVANDSNNQVCTECAGVIFYNILPIKWKMVLEKEEPDLNEQLEEG
jgi:hypothetical protein